MSKIEVNELTARTGTTITVPTGDTLAVTSNATVGGTLAVTGVHTVGNNAVVTSEGGAVTSNLAQGLAKVFCHWNSSTSIANGFNVSSIDGAWSKYDS